MNGWMTSADSVDMSLGGLQGVSIDGQRGLACRLWGCRSGIRLTTMLLHSFS